MNVLFTKIDYIYVDVYSVVSHVRRSDFHYRDPVRSSTHPNIQINTVGNRTTQYTVVAFNNPYHQERCVFISFIGNHLDVEELDFVRDSQIFSIRNFRELQQYFTCESFRSVTQRSRSA